jgi:hypothetical protein
MNCVSFGDKKNLFKHVEVIICSIVCKSSSNKSKFFMLHSFISGSTVLVRTFAASARRKGLYLHRITQDRKMRKNIHAVCGIWTHDLILQATKAFISDSRATGTGKVFKLTIVQYTSKWHNFAVCRLELGPNSEWLSLSVVFLSSFSQRRSALTKA